MRARKFLRRKLRLYAPLHNFYLSGNGVSLMCLQWVVDGQLKGPGVAGQ